MNIIQGIGQTTRGITQTIRIVMRAPQRCAAHFHPFALLQPTHWPRIQPQCIHTVGAYLQMMKLNFNTAVVFVPLILIRKVFKQVHSNPVRLTRLAGK